MVTPEYLKNRCYRIVYKMDAIPGRLKEDAAMQVMEDLLRAHVLEWEFLADSKITQKAIDFIRKLNRNEYRNAQYWGDFDTATGHDDMESSLVTALGVVDATTAIEDREMLENRVRDILERLYQRLQGCPTESQRNTVRLSYLILKVVLEDTDLMGEILDPASEAKNLVGCTKYRGGRISTQYLLNRYPTVTRKNIVNAKRVLTETVQDSLREGTA